MVSFWITVIGWWLWQFFLDAIYSTGVSPYAVRGGFLHVFGSDPAWWATLCLVLGALITMECAYRSVKRTLVIMGLGKWGSKWLSARTWRKAFGGWWRGRADTVWEGAGLERSVEEWGVEMWQEMERDPQVREMLRKLNADADGDGEQREEDEEEEEGGQKAEATLEKGKMADTESGRTTGGLFVS